MPRIVPRFYSAPASAETLTQQIAVSDIALKQPLPAELERDVMAYVGCIAGALLVEDYLRPRRYRWM